MSRSGATRYQRPASSPEEGHTPTTVELAEALLGTAHAFKQWGNVCFSHAGPGLRDLSVPRVRVLAVLDDCPETVRMGDLSAALGVTARNITTIVDGLEREGLVVRKPDPTDRRAILLELTEKGRTHMIQVHALQLQLAERMFATLSADQRRTLHELLMQLAHQVSHAAETDAHGRES